MIRIFHPKIYNFFLLPAAYFRHVLSVLCSSGIFKISIRRKSKSVAQGFTLLEIMVVLFIIAAMAVLGLNYVNRKNDNANNFLRKILYLSKELHNRARVQHSTLRLVIGLEGEDDGKLWVESSNKKILLDNEVSEKRNSKQPTKDGEEGEDADPQGFKKEEKLFEEIKLPTGMEFAKVETEIYPDGITSGKAYVHYFPQGLVERAAIHITLKLKEKKEWTIIIHPLTGHAELVARNLPLKELEAQ